MKGWEVGNIGSGCLTWAHTPEANVVTNETWNWLDPHHRERSRGLTTVERNARHLFECLPPDYRASRTRDAVQFDLPEARNLTFLVTPETLEIRFPCTEWTMGSHAPVATSRLWKRFPWKRSWGKADLAPLIDAASAAWQAEFRPCGYCGRRFEPEHIIEGRMVKGPICHGCASRHEFVVF